MLAAPRLAMRLHAFWTGVAVNFVIACGGAPSGDAEVESELVNTPGSLRANQLATWTVPDCFGRSAPVVVSMFEYKRVWAPGLRRNVNLRAYIAWPPGFNTNSGAKLPAIAMFHGGGWASGNPSYWFPEMHYLAARGMIAVSFQYRIRDVHRGDTSGSEYIYEAVKDARSAVRWMRKYGQALGINANKIATTGDSAGGHLALMAVLNTSLEDESGADQLLSGEPQGVVAFYPVLNWQLPADLSPIELERGGTLPKTWVIQGNLDTVTAPAGARSFAEWAKPAGSVYVAMLPYPHTFLSTLPMYVNGITYLDTYLINRGFVSGDPAQVWSWVNGAAAHCKWNGTNDNNWTAQLGYANNGGAW